LLLTLSAGYTAALQLTLSAGHTGCIAADPLSWLHCCIADDPLNWPMFMVPSPEWAHDQMWIVMVRKLLFVSILICPL